MYNFSNSIGYSIDSDEISCRYWRFRKSSKFSVNPPGEVLEFDVFHFILPLRHTPCQQGCPVTAGLKWNDGTWWRSQWVFKGGHFLHKFGLLKKAQNSNIWLKSKKVTNFPSTRILVCASWTKTEIHTHIFFRNVFRNHPLISVEIMLALSLMLLYEIEGLKG